MKKITFIMPTLAGGGAERIVSILANYFSDNNYTVTILLLTSDTIEYKLNRNIKIDIACIKSRSGALKKITTVKYLRKTMKLNPDTIFISFLTNENIYSAFSAIGTNTKLIISERNDPFQTIKGIWKIITNVLYSRKQCKKIIFQTNGAKLFYKESVQKKGVLISNPLKDSLPERFQGVRRKEIVTFARLEPQKNYPLLIEAFDKFSKHYPEYTLGIYGKGSIESELKKLIEEKQINDKVIFYGFCSTLHDKIRDAAMFVLPSNYEGLSNSMIEAMAIGLPCICTDCPPGGARMFIDNYENGILVPIQDVNSMCDAMMEIANNPIFTEKISRNATEIRNKLKIDIICREWEKVINEC